MKKAAKLPEEIKKKFVYPSLVKTFKLKDQTMYAGWIIGAIIEKNFKKSELKEMTAKQFEKKLAKLLKRKANEKEF